VKNGRHAYREEEAQHNAYGGDQQDDGDGAGGMEGTELPGRDAVDDGDQDGCEERGDVDDQDLFAEDPGEEKEDENAETEENMAADGAA
jgi:hypothetical protein